MRLNRLIDVYVYASESKKVDGETSKIWHYKDKFKLNKQQDVNELDRNSAGIVDYEIIKLRTKTTPNISKNDGVSFTKIKENEIPNYIVDSITKIGNTTLIVCKTYGGD